MRAIFALFVLLLVVIATGLVLYSAIGIARSSDDPAAGRTVADFAAALDDDDGARACALLTAEAQDAVESSRRKGCDQGIVELRRFIAPGGAPAFVNRAENSAIVTTTEGDAYFLDKTPEGWRLSSLGCDEIKDKPYECEIEG